MLLQGRQRFHRQDRECNNYRRKLDKLDVTEIKTSVHQKMQLKNEQLSQRENFLRTYN